MSDKSYKVHVQLFDRLSKPLKKLQAAYLADVSANCYPEKHMSEALPNTEQINLCKAERHKLYFGKFDNLL
jgi:hypothetical protein